MDEIIGTAAVFGIVKVEIELRLPVPESRSRGKANLAKWISALKPNRSDVQRTPKQRWACLQFEGEVFIYDDDYCYGRTSNLL